MVGGAKLQLRDTPDLAGPGLEPPEPVRFSVVGHLLLGTFVQPLGSWLPGWTPPQNVPGVCGKCSCIIIWSP